MLKIELPPNHLSLYPGADYRALIAGSCQATQDKSLIMQLKKVQRVAFSDMMTNGFYFQPDRFQNKNHLMWLSVRLQLSEEENKCLCLQTRRQMQHKK